MPLSNWRVICERSTGLKSHEVQAEELHFEDDGALTFWSEYEGEPFLVFAIADGCWENCFQVMGSGKNIRTAQ